MPKTDQLTAFGKFVDRYGLPLTILAMMGFAMWRFAEWSAPIADRVATKHVQFLESTEETQRQIGSVLSELKDSNEESQELIRDIHQAVIGNRPITERKMGQRQP